MTLNQNCLKANKQRLYSKFSCMEEYSQYPFSDKYQSYSVS
jgi:hypothetical protein